MNEYFIKYLLIQEGTDTREAESLEKAIENLKDALHPDEIEVFYAEKLSG